MENEPKIQNDSQDSKESFVGVGSFILEMIKIIALAFIIIFPVRVFLFQPFFVQGASMEPNFEDGQYLIVNELGFKETELSVGSHDLLKVNSFREIVRGHVVVFRYPLDTKKFFIKRVIALPGERIQVKNGKVTIFNENNPDGMELNEKEYLSQSVKTTGDLDVTLGQDEYFVMGDNRPYSSDSRYWGAVPKKDIVGEVIVRAWPLDQISVF